MSIPVTGTLVSAGTFPVVEVANVLDAASESYADTAASSAVAGIMTRDSAAKSVEASVLTLADGVAPEQAVEVARLTYQSWWSGIAGLTPVKYVDARYTTQQTEGSLSSFTDVLGGLPLSQVIEAQNPIIRNSGFAGDNGRYVEFLPETPSTPKILNATSVTVGLTRPMSIFLVARQRVIDGTTKTSMEFTNGGILRWYFSGFSSGVQVQNNQGGESKILTNPDARLSTNRVGLHAVVFNGANSYLWDNGIKTTGDLTISGTWQPLTAQIGGQGLTLNGAKLDARSGMMFLGAPTQSQLETIFANLCGQAPTNLVQVGDGLTSASLISQTAALLNEYTWCDSDAVAGSTLVDMLARFSANVTPKYQPAMRNVLVIWGGVEDIASGATGGVTASRLWMLCDNARRLGWRVIVLSMLPRGSFNVIQNAYIANFNAEITQRWHNHVDAVIRPESILGLSAYNSTCWETDRSLLNPEGYARIAKAISVAVRALCQS